MTKLFKYCFFSACLAGFILASIREVQALPNTRGWEVVNSRFDFNGDGKSDLLWLEPSNGAVAIWLMNGDQIIEASNDVGTIPGNLAGWIVVPINFDFNGDGKSDLLWLSPRGGDTRIWLMNGVRIIN